MNRLLSKCVIWMLAAWVPVSALFALPDSVRLTLPPYVYAVCGTSTALYFDNLVLSQTPESLRFTVVCDVKGTHEARRFSLTPAAGDAGEHPLTITVRDGNGIELGKASTILRVAPADAGAGKALKLLIVGDSLTGASLYPTEIHRLMGSPGNPILTMLGTSGAAKAPIAHEGYGGWTWRSFLSQVVEKPGATYRERTSPFLFVELGKTNLDLDRYFNQTLGGARPELVTFLLGINDCFGLGTKTGDPAAVDVGIDSVLSNADRLVGAFRAALPGATLGIGLTTPPNSREGAFVTNYKGAYHRWEWKLVQHRLVEKLIAKYGGREGEKLTLIPTELFIDPIDGYPVDNAVHPNNAGYRQIGTSFWCWMKWVLR
ncbi:MAG: SGNH/GDSL hydrolase family protein [Spirochaetes bacterium]|nr:SGNH/GDSL hydrolase family protein [Spirochaetota bacterium]